MGNFLQNVLNLQATMDVSLTCEVCRILITLSTDIRPFTSVHSSVYGDPKYEWNRIWLFSIPIFFSIPIPILFIPIFSIPNPIFFQNQIQYFFFLYQISYTEFKTFYSNFFDTQSETFLKPNPKPSNKSKSLETETESQLQTKTFVKFDLGFFSVLLMLLQYFHLYSDQ